MTKARRPKTVPIKAPVVIRRKGINHLQQMVRTEAMRLAKGDASRIEVISRTECIVR